MDKYLKISVNTLCESYMVKDCSNQEAIMKLYDAEELSKKKLLTDEGRLLEGEICGMKEEGQPFTPLFQCRNIEMNGRTYICLIRKYIEGTRLSDILEKGHLYSWDEALLIVKQVLIGLLHLHNQAKTVVHNDVTTRNILIGNDEQANDKVYLIGTSHLSYRINGMPTFTTFDLNPWYRAPETFKGIYDEQSDIFSLGVVFYTMLVGKEPWKVELPSDTHVQKVKQLVKKARGNDREVIDELSVSDDKKKILKAMLALDYDYRFKSVDSLLRVLGGADIHEFVTEDKEQPLTDVKTEREKETTLTPVPEVASFCDKIQKRDGGGFADVVGMENVKAMLYKEILFVLENKEKAEKYKLKMLNGALFYGPQGCGKTFIAEKLAQESNLNFMMVKTSDLGSIYIHGTQGKIAELFDEAAKKAPTILCLDEIDGMVPDRSRMLNEGQAGEVNEFLSQLNNCSERGIFVIGTSNRPDRIDPAILRSGRLDKLVYIPMPDYEARKVLFKLQMEGRLCTSDIDCSELAEATEGYVASDINFIVNEVALEAAINDVSISQELLMKQIKQTRKSVSPEEVKVYECLQARMESDRVQSDRKKIGFVSYQ